jgi:hypothetical protein
VCEINSKRFFLGTFGGGGGGSCLGWVNTFSHGRGFFLGGGGGLYSSKYGKYLKKQAVFASIIIRSSIV